MKKENKIHAFYILFILIAIIIILISVEWGAIKDLVGYIDFAATVTSLAVGLLAIVYAIHSNSTLAKNSQELTNSTRSISSDSNNLSTQIKILEDRLQILPKVLDDINIKSDKTIEHLENLQSNDYKTLKSDEPLNEETSDSIESISGNLVDAILNRTSIVGLWALYVVKKAHESSKQFNVAQISKELELSSEDYINAFLMPIEALGLFKSKSIENGSDWDKIILEVNDNLINKLYPKMESWQKNDLPESMKTYITDKATKIDAFFSK